ncbi:MAG: hypothetical protein WCO60_12930 [Verrucomicrobiota bacterium]
MSTEPTQTPSPNPPPLPAPKRRGCLFVGCLSLVGASLLLVIVGLFAIPAAIHKLVDRFTQPQAAALPPIETSADQKAALFAKVKAFQDAIETHQPAPTLVLEKDELSALIANSPKSAELKDKVFVSIEGDQIKCALSYPLGKVGLMDFSGRFLNGTGTLKLSLANGVLLATLESLTVPQHDIPEAVMNEIRKENLASRVSDNVELSKVIQKLDRIEIKNSQLIIKAREN